ncbi:hypothetical protein JW935_02645 [candidate division KSB1 bacterium]|nr:hypothetical protein [candidate division KSB1 bacterium]
MVREDKALLHVKKYSFREAILGLIILLSVGFGIRGLFGLSHINRGDLGSNYRIFVRLLLPVLIVGILFVVRWVVREDLDKGQRES